MWENERKCNGYKYICSPEDGQPRWGSPTMFSVVLWWWSGGADGHNRTQGRGGQLADWWLQLSLRRGAQADSWSPVAPDMSTMEAHGIVFHCRGQLVQCRVQAAVCHSHENKPEENKLEANLLDFKLEKHPNTLVFCWQDCLHPKEKTRI